jgi:phosphodiesterase/alkaline phosphatase D-like protein
VRSSGTRRSSAPRHSCVPARSQTARAAPRFAAYPFALGIASGSPRVDGIVLWTRLAPLPLAESGGMEPLPCEVRWELAHDESFRRIVKSGTSTAHPERAHAIHVEVDGLDAGREYFYRFDTGDARSPIGRTRTSPAQGMGDERLRLAFASCQQYEQGYYGAHGYLAAEGVDLVAFLGDYIYESTWGDDHVRKHGTEPPRTLADYRGRHALYKSDPNLQRSHECAPWIVIWDDHEVENDYANDRSETLDPQFLQRRAAAYRAYFEHMPLRASVLRTGGEVRIYDRYAWGSLATIHALDDRQYRSHQACAPEGRAAAATWAPLARSVSRRTARCSGATRSAGSTRASRKRARAGTSLRSRRASWSRDVPTARAGCCIGPMDGTAMRPRARASSPPSRLAVPRTRSSSGATCTPISSRTFARARAIAIRRSSRPSSAGLRSALRATRRASPN